MENIFILNLPLYPETFSIIFHTKYTCEILGIDMKINWQSFHSNIALFLKTNKNDEVIWFIHQILHHIFCVLFTNQFIAQYCVIDLTYKGFLLILITQSWCIGYHFGKLRGSWLNQSMHCLHSNVEQTSKRFLSQLHVLCISH